MTFAVLAIMTVKQEQLGTCTSLLLLTIFSITYHCNMAMAEQHTSSCEVNESLAAGSPHKSCVPNSSKYQHTGFDCVANTAQLY